MPARRRAAVAAVVVLALLQLAVLSTAVAVGLAAVSAGTHGVAGAGGRGDAKRSAIDETGRSVEVRPSPDRHADDRNDVWRLDGFADFSDARMRVTGSPGAAWTESRLGGRTVWADARCRASADVIDIGAILGRDGSPAEATDVTMSEDLARSIGQTAFGGAETRSDPEPATVRLLLARGGRAVELASVALVLEEPRRDGASFVVVSVRASVEHGRAVVFAVACMDTPASQADPLARDLLARFRLDVPS